MRLDKSVIFFCAGRIPTTPEAAAISKLGLEYGSVKVRNGAADARYGDKLEPADALAGSIPAYYKTASGGTEVDTDVYEFGDVSDESNELNPEGIAIIGPATVADASTVQLRCVSAELNEGSNAVVLTERSHPNVVWASSDVTKATVANTGIVTGEAAGSCNITATYTYDTGKTAVATLPFTVT